MTTNIAFHDAAFGAGYGVIDGASIVSENITESGANQQSAASTKQFVTVGSTVAVYLAFGSDPDATTATARIYQAAGTSRTYGLGRGSKVAVVTA